MKRILSLTLALCLCLTLFACSGGSGSSSQAESSQSGASESSQESQSESEESSQASEESSQAAETSQEETGAAGHANVAALKGPTAMGMVKMMSDDAASDAPVYGFNIFASADEITPKLVQGELDLAAVPANLASVLYNNTEGQVQVLAICILWKTATPSSPWRT